MKIKNIFTITALSALILAGCTEPEKAAVDGSSEPEIFLDLNGVEYTVADTVNEEVKEDGEVIPASDEQLLATYNEIVEYFAEWELPSEGILPEDHGAYDRLLIEAVAYENGYTFEKETKKLFSRSYDVGAAPAEPTEGQIPGVLMGIISEVAGDLTNMSTQNQQLGRGLLGAEDVEEILPFITMKFEEVMKYAKQEDIAEVSTEIINLANELSKELEAGVSGEALEKLDSQCRKMFDRIFLLNNAVEEVELLL